MKEILGQGKKKTYITKCDLLKVNKYYGFAVKHNRKRRKKYYSDEMKAPLQNLFNEHKYCCCWCTIKMSLNVQHINQM